MTVSERAVPASTHPGDRDEVEMELRPRVPGACTVVIIASEPGCIWIFAGDDERPEELTAPMNVNAIPERLALDIIRERLLEFAEGEVYRERFDPWD
ncbi:hypothetical protein [Klenkia brasiliensis]|uniref:hypothetical protein n=1 Tax=Klenkia brasiliensis TaxID=333142 RepID=UPI001041F667|nr:hypothetical protein [Klenkia brasiliensis]